MRSGMKHRPAVTSRGRLFRIFRGRFFPVTYVLRNFEAVRGEPLWRSLSLRSRKALLRRVAVERAVFFARLVAEKPRGPWTRGAGRSDRRARFEASLEVSDYCTHCGGCCEIASGLAVFPEDGSCPDEWRSVFASGLGPGHRFCPFLLERRRSGGSLCAIHPWRPEVCRVFGREECDFLRNDPSYQEMEARRDRWSSRVRIARLFRGCGP